MSCFSSSEKPLRSTVSLLYHLSCSVIAIISILHPSFSIASFADGSRAESEVMKLTLSGWLPSELLGCVCTILLCDSDVGICDKDIPFGSAWICLDLTRLVLSLSMLNLWHSHEAPPRSTSSIWKLWTTVLDILNPLQMILYTWSQFIHNGK